MVPTPVQPTAMGQILTWLMPVAGEQKGQEIHQTIEQILAVLLLENILRHRLIDSPERPQLGIEIGIGEEANIEDQIGIHRDPVTKAQNSTR